MSTACQTHLATSTVLVIVRFTNSFVDSGWSGIRCTDDVVEYCIYQKYFKLKGTIYICVNI